MSKRRSRKQKAPNLPEETLARARQQAQLPAEEDVEADDIVEDVEEVAQPAAKPKAAAPARKESRSAGSAAPVSPAKRRRSARDRKDKPLTSMEIAELLEHPTKTVTEEELSQQYGYVIADLRSMAILAAALLIVLIVLAQFI